MNDRELLELAAKAAGIEWTKCTCSDDVMRVPSKQGASKHWNPLTDDGDALRLAVKLKIRTDHHYYEGEWYFRAWWDAMSAPKAEEYNDDPYAATRRAIVRAAAEIGRNME